MKYFIAVAALLAVASSQDIITQLQEKLPKLNLPAEKVAKLTELFTKTAKDCIVEAAEGLSAEDSQATIDFALPAFHACAEQVKDVPAEETDKRKSLIKLCLAGKVATSSLNAKQLGFLKNLKVCLMAAKAAKASQN